MYLAEDTSLDDIIHINQKLQIKTAPGHTLISNFIFKNFPNKFLISTLLIFNSLLSLSYFTKSTGAFLLQTNQLDRQFLINIPKNSPQKTITIF